MKTSFSNPNQPAMANKAGRTIVPPITLERAERRSLVKGEYLEYKLRNTPGDLTSPVYSLSVPFFSTGTCEEWLKFRENLLKVLSGQNVTTGPGKYVVTRRLLQGDALAAFENAATDLPTETNANFDEVLQAVTAHVFPKRAAQLQKRYMRRIVRKPAEMSTKMFAARIQELNNFLPLFPAINDVIVTKLDEDEIVDVMEYGIPRSWQRKMVEHDFDSMSATVREFVDFCERMESVERAEGTNPRKPTEHKGERTNKHKNKKSRHLNDGDRKSGNFCLVHGDTGPKGHSTNECKVLLGKNKESRNDWKTKASSASAKFHKEQMAILQEMNLIDEHGRPRRIGPGSKFFDEKNKKGKRKPSVQFEKELQNLENLSISDDSDNDVNNDDDDSGTESA
jgi:hypothetical protein